MKGCLLVINILRLFIFIGICLAFWNLLVLRSLWVDEVSLALNIVNRSISELFQPLDYDQVAPIGFLIVEKLVAYAFGFSDWSFRIFPFFTYITTILFSYKLNIVVVRNKVSALFATALTSQSYFILYYSSEVKQYMSDVLICVVILTFVLANTSHKRAPNYILLGLLGAISVWFSNISVIILTSSGLYLLIMGFRDTGKMNRIILVIFVWITSFFVYYLLFIYKHPSKEFMVNFWENANAFFPKGFQTNDFVSSYLLKVIMYVRMLGLGLVSWLFVPVIGVGVIHLLKGRRWIIMLLLLPLLIHLFLAYLRLYPFHLRMLLYQLPILILLFTVGITYLISKVELRYRKYSGIVLLLPLLYGLFLIHKRDFPFRKEEIKDVLEYTNQRIEEDDLIYIYYGSILPFTFYVSNYPEVYRLEKERIIYGSKNRDVWTYYENEILEVDTTFWIIFSHVYEVNNMDGLDEREYIINSMKINGFTILDSIETSGAYGYKVMPTF